MQLDSFRYFIELARVGSFYGAAKNLFISQQGLNKAITSLESELGVKLIERESRGIRLTCAGEVMLDHAKTLMLEYSDALKDLYAAHATSSPHDARLPIHMTYYPTRISGPFVRAMKAYGSINIIEEPFQQVIDGARANTDGSELFLCDLFGAEERLQSFDDLVFEPMVVSRAGVIWRDGSPVTAHGAIHREQLAEISLSVDAHREMMRLAEYVMEGYPLNNIRQGLANPTGRIEYAVEAGDIALLYDSFGYELVQSNPEFANDTLHFTPFSTPRSVTRVGFFYSKKARPNVRARHIIEVLRAHLRTEYADYLQRYPL